MNVQKFFNFYSVFSFFILLLLLVFCSSFFVLFEGFFFYFSFLFSTCSLYPYNSGNEIFLVPVLFFRLYVLENRREKKAESINSFCKCILSLWLVLLLLETTQHKYFILPFVQRQASIKQRSRIII